VLVFSRILLRQLHLSCLRAAPVDDFKRAVTPRVDLLELDLLVRAYVRHLATLVEPDDLGRGKLMRRWATLAMPRWGSSWASVAQRPYQLLGGVRNFLTVHVLAR